MSLVKNSEDSVGSSIGSNLSKSLLNYLGGKSDPRKRTAPLGF